METFWPLFLQIYFCSLPPIFLGLKSLCMRHIGVACKSLSSCLLFSLFYSCFLCDSFQTVFIVLSLSLLIFASAIFSLFSITFHVYFMSDIVYIFQNFHFTSFIYLLIVFMFSFASLDIFVIFITAAFRSSLAIFNQSSHFVLSIVWFSYWLWSCSPDTSQDWPLWLGAKHGEFSTFEPGFCCIPLKHVGPCSELQFGYLSYSLALLPEFWASLT